MTASSTTATTTTTTATTTTTTTATNNPTMAEILPPEAWRYRDDNDQRSNLHEQSQVLHSSTWNDRSFSAAGGAGDPAEQFPGLIECHVEMLVSVLKSDVAWCNLQQTMRDSSRRGSSGILGCTNMSIRNNLTELLKEHFRQSVLVEQQHHHYFSARDPKTPPRSDETRRSHLYRNYWAGRDAEPPRSVDDNWNTIDEDSGEFLMGGTTGQGLQPISYKDVDLLQHPRSDLFGYRASLSGTPPARPVLNFV